jgi:hypothetical protein
MIAVPDVALWRLELGLTAISEYDYDPRTSEETRFDSNGQLPGICAGVEAMRWRNTDAQCNHNVNGHLRSLPFECGPISSQL